MTLTAGSRLGPYELGPRIGAGGMGEVFRARDTKLNRDVAIKLLPPGFAEDKERVARFRREAQLVASLNHPNIAAIYGLEESNGSSAGTGGTLALALELVDGEDLSQRIARGAIPVEEAIAIARQIAEGLECAHERGIVHRDLKPANVKLTADGAVKILDFGLAKAYESEPGASDSGLTQSPTMSRQMTEAGLILGTAAYMAPEQARGRPVDKRADIWSFGVVLYEMLTARRLFGGETVSDTLAAVLRQDVDLTALPKETPTSVRRLLARCLERDPKRRLRDIGEARMTLADPGAAEAGTRAAPKAGAREKLSWAIAAVSLVSLAAALPLLRRAPPARRAVRLAFDAPPNAAFDACQVDYVAVSPDGRTLVFTGRSPDGKRQLWLRPLDSTEARPLAGTDDALEPFWSPDSRSIGFGAHGKLKRVDVAGGSPRALCDAPRLCGGSWSRSGVILFVPDYNTTVQRIPAEGGEVREVTRLVSGRETSQRAPSFLPDGRHFFARGGNSAGPLVLLGSLDSPETKVLTVGGDARFAAPGWMLFMRDNVVLAQRFDAGRLELAGEAVPVATLNAASNYEALLSVSDDGVLVVKRTYAPDYQLTWLDREGRRLGTVGPPTRLSLTMAPRISPDGTRVAIQNRDPVDTERRGMWVVDLARDIPQRFSAALGQYPQWSADGKRIAWLMLRKDVVGIVQKEWNAGGEPELLTAGGEGTGGITPFPADWSVDGRFLLYVTRNPKTRIDVWALPLSGDRRPHPVLASEFDEHHPQLSPDGRFIAYRSDVSGSYEIYVQAFTEDGRAGSERWRISQGGGREPRFRRDGKELFYLSDDGRMMAVEISTVGSDFAPGAPKELFRPRSLPRGADPNLEYDVTRDGQRFLIGTILDGPNAIPPSPLVLLDWAEQLKRKAPAP